MDPTPLPYILQSGQVSSSSKTFPSIFPLINKCKSSYFSPLSTLQNTLFSFFDYLDDLSITFSSSLHFLIGDLIYPWNPTDGFSVGVFSLAAVIWF